MGAVGALLVAGLVVALVEVFPYRWGGYTGAFWALPLEDKVDHVGANLRWWWWISVTTVATTALVSAGVFGLAGLLADEGEAPLALAGVGAFVVGLAAWVPASILQSAALPRAAADRTTSGELPPWLAPLWEAGWIAELTWIVMANVAYVALGAAILSSSLLAHWVAWVAIVGGAALAGGVLVLRKGFPQLTLLVPFVVGIAVLITAVGD